MLNPGEFTLGDFSITAAGTQTGDWVTDLDGMLACLASLRLAYGSGGGEVRAYLQTDIPDGTVADIACVLFSTASEQKLINFSALTPKLTQMAPTDGTLTDDTAIDGLLGTMLRLKVVVSGTAYAASTLLSARVTVR